jgi:hypothetical protein
LNKFEKDYNGFRKAHSLLSYERKKFIDLIDDDNSNICNVVKSKSSKVISIGKIKSECIDQLLKSTKELLIFLICEKQYGHDIFDDYKLQIKYKNAHHSYIGD